MFFFLVLIFPCEMSHKEDVLGQPAMTQILSKLQNKNDDEKKVNLWDFLP